VPTALQYDLAVQTELGRVVQQTTTTAASDSVSLVCSSLANSNADATQYRGWWSYITGGLNLGAQREVANSGGYDPSTGGVTVSRAFSTAVATTTGFLLLSTMPITRDERGKIGTRNVVNDVLATIPPIDLLPVTAVTAQSKYSLVSSYSWLTDASQILGIYFQATGDEYPKPYATSWAFVYDADAPYLILPAEPFVTGETFYIKARRPAQSWIKSGGVWQADTDGLSADSDEALPLVPVVKAMALAACYRHLGSGPGPDNYAAYYLEREAFWSRKAAYLRWWDRQQADEDVRPHVRMIGSSWGRRGSYCQ
jgi:hypothetical protein